MVESEGYEKECKKIDFKKSTVKYCRFFYIINKNMEQTVIIIKPDVFVIEKRDEYSQLKKDLPSAENFIKYVK
jgi:hypothetical protein